MTISAPANNSTVTTAILPVNGTASDSGYGNSGISSVTVNGVTASGGTATGAGTANWSATITLSPGANTIDVVAKDNSSNQNPWTQSITVTYTPDMQGPSLSINSPANNAVVTSASLTVTGTASDSGYGNSGISSVAVNGVVASGGTASGAGTANWSATITLTPGANTIDVVAKDNSPNQNPWTQSITVTYTPPDTQGPSLSINSPANNAVVTSASLTVTGTASDSGYGNSGISSVAVNGVVASGGTASGAGTANWSATITLTPGANNIDVVAKDNSANQNPRTESITVTYNSVTTPTISPNGGTFAGSVQVSLSCATPGATIRYTTNGSDPTSSSTIYSSPFTLSGSAMVKAKGFLSGYNDSALASAAFTITTQTHTLTVESINSGNVNITVTVADNNGQSSGITTFNRVYNANTQVGLTAPGTAGSNFFVKWVKDDTDYSINTGINVTMDADHTVKAVYSPVPTYTVTPSAGTNGSISPNTAQAVSSGGSASFTATPLAGYVVDQWLVNGAPAQIGGTTLTLVGVTANTTVQVSFRRVPPRGTITREPAQPPGTGQQMRLSFTGLAGRTYRVEYTDNLATNPIAWQALGTVTADGNGQFERVDPPPLPGQRFYRAVELP